MVRNGVVRCEAGHCGIVIDRRRQTSLRHLFFSCRLQVKRLAVHLSGHLTFHCWQDKREGIGHAEAGSRWWRQAAEAYDVLCVSTMNGRRRNSYRCV
jgi:hypothetical protein